MNIRPQTIAHKKRHTCCGLTMIEVLVATAIGVFIGGSIITTGTTLSTTMAAIGNYCDLNSSSRNTLDVMSADVTGGW